MYETTVAYREMTRLESFVIYMALDRLAHKLDSFSEPLRALECPEVISWSYETRAGILAP